MLMFVVLGLLLNGISFARVVKTKESLLYHRWILSATVVLTLLAVFLVMLPSAFRFYIDPDVMFFSNVSINNSNTWNRWSTCCGYGSNLRFRRFANENKKMDAAYCDSLDNGHCSRCRSVSARAGIAIETKFHPSYRRTPFSL